MLSWSASSCCQNGEHIAMSPYMYQHETKHFLFLKRTKFTLEIILQPHRLARKNMRPNDFSPKLLWLRDPPSRFTRCFQRDMDDIEYFCPCPTLSHYIAQNSWNTLIYVYHAGSPHIDPQHRAFRAFRAFRAPPPRDDWWLRKASPPDWPNLAVPVPKPRSPNSDGDMRNQTLGVQF